MIKSLQKNKKADYLLIKPKKLQKNNKSLKFKMRRNNQAKDNKIIEMKNTIPQLQQMDISEYMILKDDEHEHEKCKLNFTVDFVKLKPNFKLSTQQINVKRNEKKRVNWNQPLKHFQKRVYSVQNCHIAKKSKLSSEKQPNQNPQQLSRTNFYRKLRKQKIRYEACPIKIYNDYIIKKDENQTENEGMLKQQLFKTENMKRSFTQTEKRPNYFQQSQSLDRLSFKELSYHKFENYKNKTMYFSKESIKARKSVHFFKKQNRLQSSMRLKTQKLQQETKQPPHCIKIVDLKLSIQKNKKYNQNKLKQILQYIQKQRKKSSYSLFIKNSQPRPNKSLNDLKMGMKARMKNNIGLFNTMARKQQLYDGQRGQLSRFDFMPAQKIKSNQIFQRFQKF